MWQRVSGCVAAALCTSLAFADSAKKSGGGADGRMLAHGRCTLPARV